MIVLRKIHNGAVLLSSRFDYSEVETIKGDLYGTAVGSFSLPKLEVIEGGLYLGSGTGSSTLCPCLVEVDGNLDVDSDKNFHAPNLVRVKGVIHYVSDTGQIKSYPGNSLEEILLAPVEELPILMTKYVYSKYLTSRIKQRLQHD